MPLTAQALLTEIETDPKALGYKALPDDQIVALLNKVGASGESCPNSAAPLAAVLIAVDIGEWAGLTQQVRDYLTVVAQQPTIDLTNSAVQAKIAAIFPNANGPTRTALAMLATRPCSRVEALFGPGTEATAADLIAAKALHGGYW